MRTEQESLGLTLGNYLEQVFTAHFAAPAPAVRGGDRTLAFQVPDTFASSSSRETTVFSRLSRRTSTHWFCSMSRGPISSQIGRASCRERVCLYV